MDDIKDEGLCDDDASLDEAPIRYPISCTKVPESLFDDNGAVARAHFEKFGVITKIVLQPSKQACIVEYMKRENAERAILNAGAYDGFMFDVTWVKNRRRPKVDDDPEWLPDPEVAAELAAMSGTAVKNRIPRQQKMELDKPSPIIMSKRQPVRKIALKAKVKPLDKPKSKPEAVSQTSRPLDREEIRQLVSRSWLTVSDKLKALEIRDRIIRARLSARHGAIKGCCPDMCPERERLMREEQRQISSFETEDDSSGLDPKKAVKQYSRSSADQEEPLSHDLRPVSVLKNTMLYLLHYIMDSYLDQETSLEDWFHFLWDRLRAIRKDITQQNLACKGSVALVEACARFHAHCAARLVEEPPSSFDQRLNTENLSKCLQSLKYMYNDLRNKGQMSACSREPEFRAYIILMNMHDSNFMWEVQHLNPEIQSSPEVHFAIKIYTALDNNNYIQFFKLVKETTYLNACILLRYFQDVRARALARIIKAYSPRGTSQFPANELMDMLAFESFESMESFLEHYRLQITTDQDYSFIVLDKNAFYENSDSYSPERAISLIESKLEGSLGETVYGEELPPCNYEEYIPHSSFDDQGYLKMTAILAEDQGYEPPKDTINEITNIIKNSNRTIADNKSFEQNVPSYEKKPSFIFPKPELPNNVTDSANNEKASNIFKKADETSKIAVNSNQQFGNWNSKFIFSDPVEAKPQSLWQPLNPTDIFIKSLSEIESAPKSNIFGKASDPNSIFKPTTNSVFAPPNVFVNTPAQNIFSTASSLFSSAAADVLQMDMKAQEEEKRKALEAAQKRKEEEELRRAQEKKREEIRKQEELKRKLEEERKAAELSRQKAEFARQEMERKKQELEIRIENQLQEIIPDVTNDVVNELCRDLIKKEMYRLKKFNQIAQNLSEDIITEMCEEECYSGIEAAVRLGEIRLRIVCRSVSRIWRMQVAKSRRRRSLLHITPAWLSNRSPPRQQPSQAQVLQRMRDFHRRRLPSFKMPSPTKRRKINLFETVKKYLFRRSRENEQKNVSLNVYWKLVTSIPDEIECKNHHAFLYNWFEKLFSDNKSQIDFQHTVYLNENYWYKKYAISVCNVTGNVSSPDKYSKEMRGMSGLTIYGKLHSDCLQYLVKRIDSTVMSKAKKEIIPVALILESSNNSNELAVIESNMKSYRNCKLIADYKCFIVPEFNDENLSNVSKEAFVWLAKRAPKNPDIESQLLTTYLDYCLGSELWYRFKLSLHSSIKKAFQTIGTLTDLYNEAVDKTIQIVCNPELETYPVFPTEFIDHISDIEVYPKDFKCISYTWKSNLSVLKSLIGSFKIPKYSSEWPPSSFASFQDLFRKFVHELHWFSNPEKVVLRVFGIVKSDCSVELDDGNGDNLIYSWIDIMNVLVEEKIRETIQNLEAGKIYSTYSSDEYSGNFTVVYLKRDLYIYRTTPWWYKSKFTQDISPELEDFSEDDLSDFGVSHNKKLKLDTSAESEVLDETWLSGVLEDMEQKMKQSNQCHKILTDLEKTLELEKQRQIEFELLLKSALAEG